MEQHCQNQRKKERSQEEKRQLMTRLSRIEGQVRGVRNMVEDDRYCVDVLTQVSAIQSALDSFTERLLANHIHSCVVEELRAGHDEVIDELCDTIKKIMR